MNRVVWGGVVVATGLVGMLVSLEGLESAAQIQINQPTIEKPSITQPSVSQPTITSPTLKKPKYQLDRSSSSSSPSASSPSTSTSSPKEEAKKKPSRNRFWTQKPTQPSTRPQPNSPPVPSTSPFSSPSPSKPSATPQGSPNYSSTPNLKNPKRQWFWQPKPSNHVQADPAVTESNTATPQQPGTYENPYGPPSGSAKPAYTPPTQPISPHNTSPKLTSPNPSISPTLPAHNTSPNPGAATDLSPSIRPNTQPTAPDFGITKPSQPAFRLPDSHHPLPSQGQINTSPLQQASLTVQPVGFGQVSYSPAPNNPNNPHYATGTTVTLTAHPQGNYRFGRWEGPCDSPAGAHQCRVVIRQDTVIRPHFIPAGTQLVTVHVAGRGYVESTPAGLTCGKGRIQCSAPFPDNSSVQLKATAAPLQEIRGWAIGGREAFVHNPQGCTTNAESTESTCTFRLKGQGHEMKAQFSNFPILTVMFPPENAGQATVYESNRRFECTSPNTCRFPYRVPQTTTLRANTAENTIVEGWDIVGLGTSIGDFVNIVMEGDTTVRVLLNTQQNQVHQALARVGCDNRSAAYNHYSCDSLNGYNVCWGKFRDGLVEACHADFNLSQWPELTLVPAPAGTLTGGSEAEMTVHRSEWGRRSNVRGVGYRIQFTPPPPMNNALTATCQAGHPHCKTCNIQEEVYEDPVLGAVRHIGTRHQHCNRNLEGTMMPSLYDAHMAYHQCRSHARRHNLDHWNFDLRGLSQERIGWRYLFYEPGGGAPSIGKRTTVISAPTLIHCRE